MTPATPALPGFAGGTLDRADALRADAEGLRAAMAGPGARLLLLDGLEAVVEDGRLATRPLPADADPAAHLLLGFDAEGPLFVALGQDGLPHGAKRSPGVWQLFDELDAASLAHFGAARSLVDWHARHGFCAQCGGRTVPVRAGWSRRCGTCDAEHFPRVDPVVIMLAEHDGRVLVGRQHGFPPGRYSALAGFLEPGETMEEAVARELFEEAGVRATRVQYAMSQPWPFPSSLMLACLAEVADPALTLDGAELEDAIWVDRAGVTAAMRGDADAPFIAPPKIAVAHHLFSWWLDRAG